MLRSGVGLSSFRSRALQVLLTGDPIVDFAYSLLMYRVPSALPWGLADRDLRSLGLPDEATYIANYYSQVDRENIPDLDTYILFNLFRMAAIIHGIKGRILRGNAASAEAGTMVANLDLIAHIARKTAANEPFGGEKS